MDLPFLLHLCNKAQIRRTSFTLGLLPTDLLLWILSFLVPLPSCSSFELILRLRQVHLPLTLQLHPILLHLHPTVHILLHVSTQVEGILRLLASPSALSSLTVNGGLMPPPQHSSLISALP